VRSQQRTAHAPPHILLTSRDAGGARTSDSGAGGTCGPDDDSAVHALESGGGGERDSAAGVPGRRPESWQHRGNGDNRNRERESVEQARWRAVWDEFRNWAGSASSRDDLNPA